MLADGETEHLARNRDLLSVLQKYGDTAMDFVWRHKIKLLAGTALVAFLQAAVTSADGRPVRVTVTGHSKGGALAPTLALWLADTQGPAEDESGGRHCSSIEMRAHAFASAASPIASSVSSGPSRSLSSRVFRCMTSVL